MWIEHVFITTMIIWQFGNQNARHFFVCLFVFNWGVVVLQCCVSFCWSTKRISDLYTNIPSSWASLPHPHFPSQPSRSSQSTGAELPILSSRFPLAICLTNGNAGYINPNFPGHPKPVPPPSCPHVHSLHSLFLSLFVKCRFHNYMCGLVYLYLHYLRFS